MLLLLMPMPLLKQILMLFRSNLAHLGSTANTNIGTVQSNLTAMFTTNTRAITVGGATGANLVPQANNFFSLEFSNSCMERPLCRTWYCYYW